MVDDAENAVADFFQGDHVKVEEPAGDLQASLKATEEAMASLAVTNKAPVI